MFLVYTFMDRLWAASHDSLQYNKQQAKAQIRLSISQLVRAFAALD